jgi:cytoskeletal protein CcmA (bactofilin family)
MRREEVPMADSTLAGSRAEPTTIVAEGTDFTGDFTSSCPIIVNGKIDGNVKAPAVTVTHSGQVHGSVEAKTIACKGSVSGVLEADTIELSGAIARNTVIRAQRLKLNIESTSGRIELAFGQAVTVRESEFPPPIGGHG